MKFRTALIVEPAILEQKRAQRQLQRAGFERTLVAESGPQALTMLAAELVDLVLTPWDAPELSGLELLRALRKRRRGKSVPVVILDNGLPQQIVVTAIKAGAAGRLGLPIAAAPLRKLLHAISSGGKPTLESKEEAANGNQAP